MLKSHDGYRAIGPFICGLRVSKLLFLALTMTKYLIAGVLALTVRVLGFGVEVAGMKFRGLLTQSLKVLDFEVG